MVYRQCLVVENGPNRNMAKIFNIYTLAQGILIKKYFCFVP